MSSRRPRAWPSSPWRSRLPGCGCAEPVQGTARRSPKPTPRISSAGRAGRARSRPDEGTGHRRRFLARRRPEREREVFRCARGTGPGPSGEELSRPRRIPSSRRCSREPTRSMSSRPRSFASPSTPLPRLARPARRVGPVACSMRWMLAVRATPSSCSSSTSSKRSSRLASRRAGTGAVPRIPAHRRRRSRQPAAGHRHAPSRLLRPPARRIRVSASCSRPGPRWFPRSRPTRWNRPIRRAGGGGRRSRRTRARGGDHRRRRAAARRAPARSSTRSPSFRAARRRPPDA